MVQIEISPARIKQAGIKKSKLIEFLKGMLARLAFGHYRYGSPNPDAEYLKRLETELSAYKKGGNKEHLLNVANYALLEYYYPIRKNTVFRPNVDSVTR